MLTVRHRSVLLLATVAGLLLVAGATSCSSGRGADPASTTVTLPAEGLLARAEALRREVPTPCGLLDRSARRRLGLATAGTTSSDFVAARCTWRDDDTTVALSVALDPSVAEGWDHGDDLQEVEVAGADRAGALDRPVLGPSPARPGDRTVAVVAEAHGRLIVLERTGADPAVDGLAQAVGRVVAALGP